MEPAEYEHLYELEESHWWFRGMARISLHLIDSFFRAGPDGGSGATSRQAEPARILDAGCGTGGMLQKLKDYGDAFGLDRSRQALRLAQTRVSGASRLSEGTISSLGYRDESFDLVTSFDVIYHLEVEDDVASLREFRRVLRPGGVLLLRVPAFDFLRSQHDRAVHTRQRYRRSELTEKLERAGLVPVFATYANTFLFPLVALKRLGERLVPPKSAGSEVRASSPFANRIFLWVLSLESKLLPRVSLPFGLSVVAVATRPLRRTKDRSAATQEEEPDGKL